MIEVLTNNHFEAIMDLFDGAKREVKIISPFLSEGMADKLCRAVLEKGIDCTFITRFYVQDMFDRANSIDGLEKMIKAGIKVYAVVGLHTKLYLFDGTYAVLGSANFTTSGLKTNIELSLLFSEEMAVIEDLDKYFDFLLKKIIEAGTGEVTSKDLNEARELTLKVWKGNKGHMTARSAKMYGAVLDKKAFPKWDEELARCKGESNNDVIHQMFKETHSQNEIKYNHTIWLKFDGDAENRISRDERFPLVEVIIDGKRLYIQNYPKTKKPGMVADGDEVYLAAISTDKENKNQPIIVGRGTLRGFRKINHVDPSWPLEKGKEWMEKYPWFCVMDQFEILDTYVGNGIELDKVYMELGSDTYLASFGRNEDTATVAQKHYQKAHLRLSGNAKQLIDKKFDELVKIYGSIIMQSDSEGGV